MDFKKIDGFFISDRDIVCLKQMGNVSEITFVQHRNSKQTIKKIDNDSFIVLSTGELKEVNHISSRADNKAQVSQSLKRLRDYINTNVVDVNMCKWITLTYRENMTDTERLYKDYEKFVKRFRYKYGKFEYIVACEPQARGAWHLHCIIIFDYIAPFIPNSEIERLWGQGFTKTSKLDNIDNIGAYLTAYLGDMELEEFLGSGIKYKYITYKEVSSIGDINLDKPKKFVKGGRLYMYPPNFNLYRISRGIRKPEKQYMSYKNAKEKVGSVKPTYTSSLMIIDDCNDFSNVVVYESYNTKR